MERYARALFAEGLFAVRGWAATGAAAVVAPAEPLHDEVEALSVESAPVEASPVEVEPVEVEPVEPAPAEPREPAGPEPLVTETLGNLLADQGHVEEAAEVYGRVLSTHPSDAELRQRALETARSKPWPLTADDLLPAAERQEMDPEAARREVLGRYLARVGRERS